MKKLYIFLITLFIGISLQGCSQPVPELKPVKTQLPEIPQSLYAVTEITPEAMAELEKQVSQLDRNDFFHTDRIAELEEHGIYISVDNIQLQDCNTITFDVVLAKADGTTEIKPAIGMLMYGYLPDNEEFIYGLQVLWGNLSVCDDVIVMANIDDLSLWRSDLSYAEQSDYFFILDVVKSKDGYLLPYFSSDSSGFMDIAASGRVLDMPLLFTEDVNVAFGTQNLTENRNFNTTARASNRINCFYGDETEKQIFMAFERDDYYYGMDYAMYDSESGQFLTSCFLASYSTQDSSYELYAMCMNNGGYYIGEETTFLAVKRADGQIADRVVFKSAVNPVQFGKDTRTGWNTYTHISLSEDMNILSIGCNKTRKVINIDFSQGTAETLNTSTMPRMHSVENSPNSMHMLYLTDTQHGTSLMVRSMSGSFEMDHISDVTGEWGVDCLAGFYTHKYIYVLTENRFELYSWDGSNCWEPMVATRGNYAVNTANANRLCDNYV